MNDPRDPDLSIETELIAPSAMHESYGGLLRLLFERVFGPIDYPQSSAQQIRELAAAGVVVYVTRARSTWLALYLNHALSRLRLPLAGFVGGINLLLWQPVDRLWKLWRQRRRALKSPWRKRYQDAVPTRSEALLAEIVLRGEAVFLALQAPGFELKPKPKANDYLRALVAAQRVSGRPIYLVPHAVSDRIDSGPVKDSFTDYLFGRRGRPGQRRKSPMVGLSRYARVRVADAIDLGALVAEHADEDDSMLARRVRHELDRRIAAEERVIAGPELPPLDTVVKRVLRESLVRDAVECEATKKRAAVVEARAARYVREIAARYNPRVVSVFAGAMGWVYSRIYDGIVVDDEGLGRVVEASRRGPVVFCPSHKSHVDYLVVSSVLWQQGMAPPHIAAGVNLSFFPLGALFRGGGAFFLRRSFRDNPLYGAVLRSYVIELVRQGTSMEFFIEGTRSRTGKVLMPRMGLLSMVADAWRRGVGEDVLFMPVSVDYERIVEARAYERELMGAEKKPEDIGGLLKTTSVLRSRYGRVYVQFGHALSLAELAQKEGLSRSAEPAVDEAWRVGVKRLGYRILHRVATISSVTPTAVAAAVLLGHPGRGLTQRALVDRVHQLVEYLDAAAARLTEVIADPETRVEAVLEAILRLAEEGAVVVDRPGRGDAEPIYRVVEERRITLDFYKNSLMNYIAPAALVCRSLARRGGVEATYADVHADCRFLSRLMKREFLWRVDASFDTHFDDTLASLAIRGFIDVYEDGRIWVREPASIRYLAGLLDSFLEAYYITATTLNDLRRFPLWQKELTARAMERARRAVLEGQLHRPESAGRILIENAVTWMVDTGAVEMVQSDRKRTLRLNRDYEVGKLDTLIHDIRAYL
ncbi:MAG: 1-acyl-sn-glycerol-3-phosphate acyltransferase [Deltaproteobacteria bacterium]|nr:1-acyl-sn-glycerol-3-phosphate acyltransferase [Deltaproteobacteria bacterium]